MPIQDQSILSFGLKARFKMLIIIWGFFLLFMPGDAWGKIR
jgi:hypothetical protein